jgi:hypothetical protein
LFFHFSICYYVLPLSCLQCISCVYVLSDYLRSPNSYFPPYYLSPGFPCVV